MVFEEAVADKLVPGCIWMQPVFPGEVLHNMQASIGQPQQKERTCREVVHNMPTSEAVPTYRLWLK